jgi:hypothetical protein
MPVATKTVKCPTCGAKTPAGSDRCRICTRTLGRDAARTQQAFEDALYSRPVRGEAPARRQRSLTPLIVAIVVGLLAWNYFSLGYGPTWAHRTEAHQPGGNWRTFRGVPGITVFLPGSPIVDAAQTEVGGLRRARVGVDQHWDAILDADVLSTAAQHEAESHLEATLAVGQTAAPADVLGAATPVVAALLPGLTLSDAALIERPATDDTQTFDLTAAYSGYPAASSEGNVRARLVAVGGRLDVAATFFATTQSVDLHDHLIAGFQPDGTPAPTEDGD